MIIATYETTATGPLDFKDWLTRTKENLQLQTDRQLAEYLGIETPVISFLYSEKRGPSALHIEQICKSLSILETSPQYFELLKAAQRTRLKLEKSQRRNAERMD